MRTFSTYEEYERALLYQRFSLQVDAIELYRSQLPEEDWVRSPKLDSLYRLADSSIVRLKRLGGI